MYDSIKDIIADVVSRQRKEVIDACSREVAARMIRKYGNDLDIAAIEEIAEITDLPEETIRQMANQLEFEG